VSAKDTDGGYLMPQFRVNVTIQQKGALFNTAASKAAAARMVTNINEALAKEGVNRVKHRLGQVLQNPTGYLESKIQTVKGSTYRGVSDGGVVYGGWIEGVDSRNKTTRFKGYRTFRTVQQTLARDKEQIAQPFVNKFVSEMNR
jgi:hypothetical protein